MGSAKEKPAGVEGGKGGGGGTVCFSFVHHLLYIDLKPETDSTLVSVLLTVFDWCENL